MDVGSKGGYFSEKSPKLLLHEWCLQQKRPKPRYKSLPDEAGGFRCKVLSDLLFPVPAQAARS